MQHARVCLHQTNDPRENLRKIGCVKEPSGKVNREVVKQIHGIYELNTNFTNRMNSLTHIVMFCSLIDLKNKYFNQRQLKRIREGFINDGTI